MTRDLTFTSPPLDDFSWLRFSILSSSSSFTPGSIFSMGPPRIACSASAGWGDRPVAPIFVDRIHGQRKNYDTVSIEGRARRSEGTETNSFNAVFGAWLAARIFPRCSLHKPAAPGQRPIAFALEGSPLDRCRSLFEKLSPLLLGGFQQFIADFCGARKL